MKDNQSILHALLNLTCICSITIMNNAVAIPADNVQVLSTESIKELSKKPAYELPKNATIVIKVPSAIQEYKPQSAKNISVVTSSASSQINQLSTQKAPENGRSMPSIVKDLAADNPKHNGATGIKEVGCTSPVQTGNVPLKEINRITIPAPSYKPLDPSVTTTAIQVAKSSLPAQNVQSTLQKSISLANNDVKPFENSIRTISLSQPIAQGKSDATAIQVAKTATSASTASVPLKEINHITIPAPSYKPLDPSVTTTAIQVAAPVTAAPSSQNNQPSQPIVADLAANNAKLFQDLRTIQISKSLTQEPSDATSVQAVEPILTSAPTDTQTCATYNLQPEAALRTIVLPASFHELLNPEAGSAIQSTDPIESTEPTPPQEEETQTTAQAPLKSMLRTRSVLTAPAAQVEEESTSGTEDGAKDDADTNAEKPASAEKEKPEEVAETAEQDSNNGGDNNTQENEKNTDAQEQSSDDSAATPKAPDLDALLEASLGRAREILQTRAGSMNLLLAGNEALNNLQSAALEQLANNPNRSAIVPVCVTQIGRTRYATGSSLDLNSYSLAFGAAKQMRALTVIPFAEFGFGDSTSKLGNINPYDSKHRYYGVGSIVRLDLSPAKNHAFVDGSIRAGRVDAKHEGDNGLSYKSGYAAMHAGLGYTCTNSAGWIVDLYGRYFLNHLFSAHTTLYDCLAVGDTMQLKMRSMTCHTGQIGATAKHKLSKNAQLSLGIGYQYIFSGRAKGRLDGMGLVIPNAIKGSSAFAELMFKVYKTNSPLSISVGLRGYVGSKQGYAGVIRLSYQF